MRRPAAALLLGLLGSAAPARAIPGFYDYETLPASPSSDPRPAAAHLRPAGGQGSRCSGTYISRSGHILTAAHCVRGLLDQARRGSVGGYELLAHRTEVARYDAPTGLRAAGAPVRLLLAGKGLLDAPERFTSEGLEDAAELRGELRDLNMGDWAILRAEDRLPTPCVQAAASSPEEGDPVWIVGYPGKAPRDNDGAPGSPGQKASDALKATHGRVLRRLDASEWFELHDGPDRPLLDFIFRAPVAEGDIVLSDADAYDGMSGGGIFDRSGRLVALHNESANSNISYIKDSSRGISVARVRRMLAAAGLEPGTYFSCP